MGSDNWVRSELFFIFKTNKHRKNSNQNDLERSYAQALKEYVQDEINEANLLHQVQDKPIFEQTKVHLDPAIKIGSPVVKMVASAVNDLEDEISAWGKNLRRELKTFWNQVQHLLSYFLLTNSIVSLDNQIVHLVRLWTTSWLIVRILRVGKDD
jgi:hypothetical protein